MVRRVVNDGESRRLSGRGVIPCYRPDKGVIETERLRVVSFDLLEETGGAVERHNLQLHFGIEVPLAWPPELLGRLLPAYLRARREGHPESSNMVWLVVLKGSNTSLPVAVGLCGFLAPPDEEGRMEIRYAVLEKYSGRGLATEAATAVVSWAFRSGMARSIFAQTGKDEFAAMQILAKLGFVLVSKGEGETLLFERYSPFANHRARD